MRRRTTHRALVWTAVAAQAAFVASWVVAGALEPGYSHIEQGISELGAGEASDPVVANAGIVILGLSIVALAVPLAAVLPRRPAAAVAGGLFAAAGAAMALAGVLPLDCGMSDQRCEDLWRAGALSWQHDAHLWAGLAFDGLFVATPLAVARALWPSPSAAAALAAGAAGVAIAAIAFVLLAEDGVAAGLVQRSGFVAVHAWLLIVATGILHATRGEPRLGALVPLRPRDFLARAWTGEGELVLWPFVVGRRFRQRFEGHRRSTWISESVWRVEDEARFGDGRVLRRHMFCEFVGEERVRITATDLPDGAEVRLVEGGYRVASFRMSFPIGPLPLLVHCHDRSRVEPDGTLVNVTDVRAVGVGLPLARVTFRVRPVQSEPGSAPPRRAPAVA